ncbi:MAG: ACT domain-containing protein [Ruminococcaceae bacterium]|nr:ACT domain-containing protein [Oscillospiraceae bacterium]
MKKKNRVEYYLVESSAVPEVYKKVIEAKELLAARRVKTVSEAVLAVGISRSAFYKYKDLVSLFRDMQGSKIVTFNAMLLDKKGTLSALLALIASTGASILTINQSLPTNGVALLTVSLETEAILSQIEAFIEKARTLPGVISFDVLSK